MDLVDTKEQGHIGQPWCSNSRVNLSIKRPFIDRSLAVLSKTISMTISQATKYKEGCNAQQQQLTVVVVVVVVVIVVAVVAVSLNQFLLE